MSADAIYLSLLRQIDDEGDLIESRNGLVKSSFLLPTVRFDSFPLVTVRPVAVKTALLEMEWFLSCRLRCPAGLLSWWDGQLDPHGCYVDGYSAQFRMFDGWFDQIENLVEGLIDHPTSRRLLLSSWHASDMANITKTNSNPNTPTTCHTTVAQFFVRSGRLHMRSYQRSADMLLGVPHNWVQSWALLVWLARRSNLDVGSLLWTFGDAHIYQEDSHLLVLRHLLDGNCERYTSCSLSYSGSDTELFLMSDFSVDGEIASPITTIRPKRM